MVYISVRYLRIARLIKLVKYFKEKKIIDTKEAL